MRPRFVRLPLAPLLAGMIGAIDVRGEEESPLPGWGKRLFVKRCAPCHGVDGRGAGPAAAALKTVPPDLTQIRRRHDGTFSFLRVAGFIDGERPPRAHGSREMPVWGKVFRWSEGEIGARAEIYALVHYLESIQQE